MDKVFANCSEEVEMYPLTTAETAESQWANAILKHLFNSFTPIRVMAGAKPPTL
jgi:hypothetical protein